MLALYLGLLDADFEIVGAPELVEALRVLTARYQRAADASQLKVSHLSDSLSFGASRRSYDR